MVRVFNKYGVREETYARGFQPAVSIALIEKYGKEKIGRLCRQCMTSFREVDETVPSFISAKLHFVTVDASVRDRLKALANQRGLTIASLIREALHCHLLKNAEPVRVMPSKHTSLYLQLSPFEEKLLNQWREKTGASWGAYASTLATVSPLLPHPDLPARLPRGTLWLYPDPEFEQKFSHSAQVYGYTAPSLLRQILAFLDRPFSKERTQDRYLDWLTGGYAHALSA